MIMKIFASKVRAKCCQEILGTEHNFSVFHYEAKVENTQLTLLLNKGQKLKGLVDKKCGQKAISRISPAMMEKLKHICHPQDATENLKI